MTVSLWFKLDKCMTVSLCLLLCIRQDSEAGELFAGFIPLLMSVAMISALECICPPKSVLIVL